MSQMIEVKTADLIGYALDWAVGEACCADVRELYKDGNKWLVAPFGKPWNPSAYWEHGGPLIEKYDILFGGLTGKPYAVVNKFPDGCGVRQNGPTKLIAACRSIVAAKLGEVVSVPAELVQP